MRTPLLVGETLKMVDPFWWVKTRGTPPPPRFLGNRVATTQASPACRELRVLHQRGEETLQGPGGLMLVEAQLEVHAHDLTPSQPK